MTHPNVAIQILIDVQRLEERLVQLAALLVVTALVEPLGILKELQARLDDLPGHTQILVGVGQPLRKALALPCDLVQAGADLLLGEGAVGGQVDEVGLLGVELTKLFGELGMEELGGGLLLVQHGRQVGAHDGGELGREADARVVFLDGLLDLAERDVWQLACVAVPPIAEEVAVGVAVPIGGLAQDHAAAFTVAAQAGTAEQRAF
ncbi:hypothetical protein AB0I50_30465 [Streptomyces prunicolor]